MHLAAAGCALFLSGVPALCAVDDATLEQRCAESAALAILATAVDGHSPAGAPQILAEVCAGYPSPSDAGDVGESTVRSLLDATSRLLDRMGDEHLPEQAHAARLCAELALRVRDPSDALRVHATAFAARAVRLACRTGVASAADALALARLLDEGRRADGSSASLDALQTGVDAMLEAPWFGTRPPDGGMLADRGRVLAILEDIGPTPTGRRRAVERVGEHLAAVAGTSAAAPWIDALQRAADTYAVIPSESPRALLEEHLVPLSIPIGPLSDFTDAYDRRPFALDDWLHIRGGTVPTPRPGDDLRIRVLLEGQAVDLPRAEALGLSSTRLPAGLDYVLTWPGERGHEAALVLVSDARASAISVPLPDRVPDDALFVYRTAEPDRLRMVRRRPWSTGDWRTLLAERSGSAVVDAFLASLRAASDGHGDGDVAMLGSEQVSALGAVRSYDVSYLQGLRLPDANEAAWLEPLLRAVDAGSLPAGASLFTSQAVEGSDGSAVYVTCDLHVLALAAGDDR